MSDNQITCGVIGLGNIGMGYDNLISNDDYIYSHSKAISIHPDFHLSAGIDIDETKQIDFNQLYAVPAYSRLDEIDKEQDIDLFIIATPSNSHLSIVNHILSVKKSQYILCEKPVSDNLSEAEEIYRLCKENNITLFVNYIRRFLPGVLNVKRNIENGKIQAPAKGVVWYTKGFINNASHYLNLLQYLLGNFQNFKIINVKRLTEKKDFSVEVKVEFELGEVLFSPLEINNLNHCALELLFANGRLSWGMGKLLWQEVAKDKLIGIDCRIQPDSVELPTGIEKYQYHVYDFIRKYIKDMDYEKPSDADALETMKFISKILN